MEQIELVCGSSLLELHYGYLLCHTCGVDAGNFIRCQGEAFITKADCGVYVYLVAFIALTVAAVLHRADDHLAIPLHTCRHPRTHTQTQKHGRAEVSKANRI